MNKVRNIMAFPTDHEQINTNSAQEIIIQTREGGSTQTAVYRNCTGSASLPGFGHQMTTWKCVLICLLVVLVFKKAFINALDDKGAVDPNAVFHEAWFNAYFAGSIIYLVFRVIRNLFQRIAATAE